MEKATEQNVVTAGLEAGPLFIVPSARQRVQEMMLAKDPVANGAPHSGAVIVSGPAGCGKTRNAKLLAELFGKDTVLELEKGSERRSFPDNYLVLTNDESIKEAIPFERALSRLERVHLIAPSAIPPFCRDCKHARYNPQFSTCTAPEIQVINVVHGLVNKSCEMARRPASRCGVEACLFVPKPPPSPPRKRRDHPQ